MLNFSTHRSSWWQGVAIVASGLAAWTTPAPSAVAQVHTNGVDYRKTQLPSGLYSLEIWGMIIMNGYEETREFAFTVHRAHGWFGCERTFTFEKHGQYAEGVWQRRGTMQPTVQTNFYYKMTFTRDPGDWFVIGIRELEIPTATSARVSGSSSTPLVGGRVYTWDVENDPDLAASSMNARITSVEIGSHALAFSPSIARGAGEEVNVDIPLEPALDACGTVSAPYTTIPCVARYNDGSSAITWAHGPSADDEAQCGSYALQINPEDAVFQPGVTDIGNHGDDIVTMGVTLPFGVRVGRTTYYSARASSNGNLQFTTAASTYINQLLPALGIDGPMICPLWDDLRTDGPGQGIFTSTTGVSPSQRFNIEWRHGFYSGPAGMGITSISFYEGQSFFDVFYEIAPSNGESATIGVQHGVGMGASATLYSHDAPVPGSLSGVRAIRYHCVAPANPACSLVLSRVSQYAGAGFDAFAVVKPGVNPISAGLSVTLDATSINAGMVTLRDDGVLPDMVLGDGVFSGSVVVGADATLGNHTLTSVVQDALFRGSVCGSGFTVVLPPPSNDGCDNALAFLPGSIPFDNTWATTSVLASACAPIGTDTWWSFQAPASGNWVFDTCGSIGDTVLEVYDSCYGTLLDCDDDACGPGSGSRVDVCMSAGQTVLVRLGGYGAGTTSGMLHATLGVSTCPSTCHGACVSDFDDGSGTGTPDGGVTIDDLLYYLFIFEAGQLCSDVDDGSGTGTLDGGVTIDDLLYYLVRFESGC